MAHNSLTKLRFLREIYQNRPGSQTIHAFNRSLESAGVPAVVHQPSVRYTNIGRHLDEKGLLRNYFRLPGKAFVVALMWPKVARFFPIGFVGELIPLCFDCWPSDYDKWESIFRRHRIKTAFFTARQSQQYFQNKIDGMNCFWLPEAGDPAEYQFTKSLHERKIDVLELGRRLESYHEGITARLEKESFQHLYVREGERRMFSTRQDLMDGWAETKVSICYPKSITSEERSGGVETVTFRYFESMASRCLILGHCPLELKDIFGYSPVVEADMNDPAGQIVEILQNIEKYQPLVEKNHKRMLEVGSWDSRVREMLNILKDCGYTHQETRQQ